MQQKLKIPLANVQYLFLPLPNYLILVNKLYEDD